MLRPLASKMVFFSPRNVCRPSRVGISNNSLTGTWRWMSSNAASQSSVKNVTGSQSLIYSQAIRRPMGVRLGWTKDVITEVLPFTSELVTSRSSPFESLAVGYCVKQPPVPSAENPGLFKRRMEDSWLEIIFPFSNHEALRDSMMRSDGKTVRYGKLFEILDALAADVSYRHCDGLDDLETSRRLGENAKRHYVSGAHVNTTVVTAAVDGVHASANIDANNDLKLQGYLTYVGKSSMEVTIDIITVMPDGMERKVGDTQFIMVARDAETNKAKDIHQLILSDEESVRRFKIGQERATLRRTKASTSLSVAAPLPEEMEVIHRLYMESRSLKSQKDEIIKSALGKKGISNHSNSSTSSPPPLTTTTTTTTTATATPTPKPSNFKWMKNTVFKSVLLMHPQDRNVHGKIFGGFLMREAFEIAWVAAITFFGVPNPAFVSVDDIQFVKPVNIGGIMEFVAAVVYSSDDKIVVQVNAYEVGYASGSREKTNALTYVFAAPKDGDSQSVSHVMPSTYEEFVSYLEGRRTLTYLLQQSQNQTSPSA